mmetsp:Transcript_22822/g.58093  ORF Transcript_22822/g.58093 Transcript_22822/m.58093 type:complete len:297 (+) Transcript_22822:997-1887(+)
MIRPSCSSSQQQRCALAHVGGVQRVHARGGGCLQGCLVHVTALAVGCLVKGCATGAGLCSHQHTLTASCRLLLAAVSRQLLQPALQPVPARAQVPGRLIRRKVGGKVVVHSVTQLCNAGEVKLRQHRQEAAAQRHAGRQRLGRALDHHARHGARQHGAHSGLSRLRVRTAVRRLRGAALALARRLVRLQQLGNVLGRLRVGQAQHVAARAQASHVQQLHAQVLAPQALVGAAVAQALLHERARGSHVAVVLKLPSSGLNPECSHMAVPVQRLGHHLGELFAALALLAVLEPVHPEG